MNSLRAAGFQTYIHFSDSLRNYLLEKNMAPIGPYLSYELRFKFKGMQLKDNNHNGVGNFE